MNDVGSGRARTWNIYTAAAASGSLERSPTTQPTTVTGREGPWRSFGTSSMNAISLGFVATAILISMFLIMAIFEHLFRPDPSSSFDSPRRIHRSPSGSATAGKLADQVTLVPMTPAPDFSVVMPGEQFPTYIAQPAPLPPCRREGIRWPSHNSPPFFFR